MSNRALDYYYDKDISRAAWTVLSVFRRETQQSYLDALAAVTEDQCRAAIMEACS